MPTSLTVAPLTWKVPSLRADWMVLSLSAQAKTCVASDSRSTRSPGWKTSASRPPSPRESR